MINNKEISSRIVLQMATKKFKLFSTGSWHANVQKSFIRSYPTWRYSPLQLLLIYYDYKLGSHSILSCILFMSGGTYIGSAI